MLEAIISTLKKSAKSDVFCTKFEVSSRGLSLTVDTLGPVSFPTSARIAKTLNHLEGTAPQVSKSSHRQSSL